MQVRSKALADPSRVRIVRHLATSPAPVGIGELTDLLGFNHNAVRQHVAVLVESGVLTEADEVRSTRGRPRKLYELRHDALDPFVGVTGSYERLAALLLEVVTTGDAPYDVGVRAGRAAAEWMGAGDVGEEPTETGTAAQSLRRELSLQGFEPGGATGDAGDVVLHRCPFADVASKDQAVVCDLHHGLIDGQLAAMSEGSESPLSSKLAIRDPHRAGCRVSIITKPS